MNSTKPVQLHPEMIVRERTRHLIELGGLAVKAGLVELTVTIAPRSSEPFLGIADKLRDKERGCTLALWKRKGKRAFETGAEAAREKAI